MDARFRRLPNEMVLIVGLFGLVTNLMIGGWPQFSSALMHAALALVIGFGLYAVKVIGGADGKYYAAVAAWFPLQHAVLLIGWVSAAGFVLALGFLGARLMDLIKRRESDKDSIHRQVPFGIAIAFGGLCTAYGLTM